MEQLNIFELNHTTEEEVSKAKREINSLHPLQMKIFRMTEPHDVLDHLDAIVTKYRSQVLAEEEIKDTTGFNLSLNLLSYLRETYFP